MFNSKLLEKSVTTSNKLALTYKLENPYAWLLFEHQQKRAYRRAEHHILHAIHVLGLFIGLFLTMGVSMLNHPEPTSFYYIVAGGSVTALGSIFQDARYLHEPVFEILGWANILTLYRGYECAKMLADQHGTRLWQELTIAYQADYRVLTL